MLTVRPGHGVDYLTKSVAQGRENYYRQATELAGEPPGVWHGAGAAALGLTGTVDNDLLEAIYTHLRDPRDPAAHDRDTWEQAATLGSGHRRYRTAEQVYEDLLGRHPGAGPEDRDRLWAQAERSARQAVAYIDLTFSAPKSVTVLQVAFERAAGEARAAGQHDAATAWDQHAAAVEAAVLAAGRASLDYLQDVAGYARVGHHGGGAGRWIDAHAWTVAQFVQHDSRDKDPHLHVHQVVLNRVECADGTWRTLDSRAIHATRGAAAAVAERVMESELARTLGVRFETRPDGTGREVVGVDQQVMDLFSSRARAVTARAADLIARFEQAVGRPVSSLERDRLSRRAWASTRAAKVHRGESTAARLARWEAELRAEVGDGLTAVARRVLGRAQRAGEPARFSEVDVIDRALATLGERKQAWSRADAVRAVSDALPGQLGVAPARVRPLLDRLADAAIARAVPLDAADTTPVPDVYRRADGTSMYVNPTGARFATPGQMVAERALAAATVERGAHRFTADEAADAVARFARGGRPLGDDQAAAVTGVMTSGARLEAIVASAGTGKSFVVGTLADQWTESGRRAFGLAPSQAAAEVLARDGVTAANTARWLGAQRRLQAGTARPDDEAWRLRDGDLVVVDEAGMADTAALAEVHALVRAAGGKLLLVGDPRQLAAVGAGGALADLAATGGAHYELAEVRRFTNGWEGPASLRLRDGDQAAADEYHRQGRLRDGGTTEQAETAAGRAWLADTLAGRESLLLVGSNEAAGRVNATLRAELVALGRVAEHGVPLAEPGTVAGVGDRIEARRNGWALIGEHGNTRAPLNRETYRVTATAADGRLVVAADDGTVLILPADYVTEHVALAYAATVHAAQGRTVDTAHTVVGAGGDPASTYVSMTRGRAGNTAWVVTRRTGDDQATGETLRVAERDPRAVFAEAIATDPAAELAGRGAGAQAAESARQAASVGTHLDRLADQVALATAGRLAGWLDGLAATGELDERHRVALAADPATDGLDRLLRTAELAGHDPAAVLHAAVTGRSLTGSRSPAQVLHSRITGALAGQLNPEVGAYTDLVPGGLPGEDTDRLRAVAEAADDRRHRLGADTAEAAPQWAVEALGPVPADPAERLDWEQRAGWAAAYREVAGLDDQAADEDGQRADPLGPAPGAGLAESHAAWRAAHAALRLPDAGPDEAELSDGALRSRVTAWEREQAWAPVWVGDDLADARQAADAARVDATLWAARADAATDAGEAGAHRAAAEQARTRAADADTRVAQLEVADDARVAWRAHTAVTRDLAARAGAALGARGVDVAAEPRVTADEWLAAHLAEQDEDERHREITPADVADDDRAGALDSPYDDHAAEARPVDVRDTATVDPSEHVDRDGHRSTAEVAAAVARAQQALAALAERAADDARVAAEDDQAREVARLAQQRRDDHARDDDPVLQR